MFTLQNCWRKNQKTECSKHFYNLNVENIFSSLTKWRGDRWLMWRDWQTQNRNIWTDLISKDCFLSSSTLWWRARGKSWRNPRRWWNPKSTNSIRGKETCSNPVTVPRKASTSSTCPRKISMWVQKSLNNFYDRTITIH